MATLRHAQAGGRWACYDKRAFRANDDEMNDLGLGLVDELFRLTRDSVSNHFKLSDDGFGKSTISVFDLSQNENEVGRLLGSATVRIEGRAYFQLTRFFMSLAMPFDVEKEMGRCLQQHLRIKKNDWPSLLDFIEQENNMIINPKMAHLFFPLIATPIDMGGIDDLAYPEATLYIVKLIPNGNNVQRLAIPIWSSDGRQDTNYIDALKESDSDLYETPFKTILSGEKVTFINNVGIEFICYLATLEELQKIYISTQIEEDLELSDSEEE